MEDWIEVESSFISAIAVDEQSRIIAVRLKDDSDIFVEFPNPRVDMLSLFWAFLRSSSKGKFFNNFLIKKKSPDAV